jgi:hypothetical protein
MTEAERTERRFQLCVAFECADRQDALAIAAAYLEINSAGMPELATFSDVRADAAFWADVANPLEVQAYFAATLRRLGNMAQGIGARKRLLVSLWQSLPISDRRAFLSRVDDQGRFTRGQSHAA